MRPARLAGTWLRERLRADEDPHWRERGEVVAGALWLAALFVFTVVTVALVGSPRLDQRLAEAEARKKGLPLPVAQAPAAPQARTVLESYRDFPAPPQENAACSADVLRSYYPTLSHNGFSWVDSADPAPAVNSAGAAAWRGRMNVKVGGAWALFKERNCNAEPPRGTTAPPPPKEDPRFRELPGIYHLRPTGPDSGCGSVLPSSLQVLAFQSGTEFAVNLVPSGGASPSGRYLASINSYSFRLNDHRRDAPSFTMEGTFIGQSGGIIVEGTFSYDGNGFRCQTGFAGTRNKP